ncbi:MAG: bacillithiol biosynthesis cysteine-adding enzyme BshC [Chitinophagales bacterium]
MILEKKIALSELGLLPSLVQDYLSQEEKLKQLYSFAPSWEGLALAKQAKANFTSRDNLYRALRGQYLNFQLSVEQENNLTSLQAANTFTITTAHQLCLFTGPSYFIYKILSAIKLARLCKEKFPEDNFVPVYWMGSEDHDFEEVNHTYIYAKKLEWNRASTGAVGRLSLEGMDLVLQELEQVLGSSEEAQFIYQNIAKYFQKEISYGKAFQEWILSLFSSYGLLVLDQDDALLKKSFKAVLEDEIFNNSANLALEKNEKFLAENYHVQANSREINVFYLSENKRERIERKDSEFHLVNTSMSFSETEMKTALKEQIEAFSPNVILRPLYQESVLPNIAFIGGPGEVSYWLQLKDLFAKHQIQEPVILLRDMAINLAANQLDKLSSWGLGIERMFEDLDQLKKALVEADTEHELELHEEREALIALFEKIKHTASLIEKNLSQSVEAEQQKVLNSFSNLEAKLLRAEKKLHEQKLNQLEKIKEKLFPEQILQERRSNFLEWYIRHSATALDSLLSSFNPLEQEMKIFRL